MKKVSIYIAAIMMLKVVNAFSAHTGNQKDSATYFNWFNLDYEMDGIPGISTDKAYNELLGNKKSTTVVVAVIDGGIDIHHEDLKGKIWINEDEIPGNGKDDDENGFIDDVYGWNFLGAADGRNIKYENYEATRLYKKYKNRFSTADTIGLSGKDLELFSLFKKARKVHFQKYTKALNEMAMIEKFEKNYYKADSIVKSNLKKDTFSIEEIKSFNASDSREFIMAKSVLLNLSDNGFCMERLKKYKDRISVKLNYHFNTDYDPRSIVNDDPENPGDSIYGNNDVISGTSDHGTFVSGIIAGNRNNNIGMKGIANDVRIMAIRAVPDGDERDKDVANAIKYAVNNGAKIINMSFGKDFTPQKELVDEAIRYAAANDVLLIHAAGNESDNTDKNPRYPNVLNTGKEKITDNWINVGATSRELDDYFVGDFSNYGKNSVELFAPGVDVFSLQPDNKYDILDGTSFASPMVAGTAALIKSYYPEMTAAQIKDVILSSVSLSYKRQKVLLPAKVDEKKKRRTKFKKLSSTGGVLNVYNALQLCEAGILSE
ncbi:MAG: S8 family serine peptidase [Bacteroidales bacterium]|nr:S8 family serine peptidase [Bacteroidales bacterium]